MRSGGAGRAPQPVFGPSGPASCRRMVPEADAATGSMPQTKKMERFHGPESWPETLLTFSRGRRRPRRDGPAAGPQHFPAKWISLCVKKMRPIKRKEQNPASGANGFCSSRWARRKRRCYGERGASAWVPIPKPPEAAQRRWLLLLRPLPAKHQASIHAAQIWRNIQVGFWGQGIIVSMRAAVFAGGCGARLGRH